MNRAEIHQAREDGRKRFGFRNGAECDRCYKPMAKGEGTLAPDDQIVCDACIKKYDNTDEGQSKLLHEWVDGKCKTCGTSKTENANEMCNSKCPSCKDEMSDHDADGMCDTCGSHCG